ncbi:MAG: heavy-metal-associated domain-containing protein [Halanaeroarchaeum sp.]
MSTTVTVTDMSCDGCEDIVEDAVTEVQGVESVAADRDAETVTVEGDADVDAILEAIDFAGYTASLGGDDGDDASSTADSDSPEDDVQADDEEAASDEPADDEE